MMAPDFANQRDTQDAESSDEISDTDTVPTLQNQGTILSNNFFLAQGIS